MRSIGLITLPLWLVIACQFDPSIPPLAGNPDASTADAARPDTAPGCSDQCISDDTQYCDPSGVIVDCPLGCSTAGGDHCLQLVPSNGADMTHLVDVDAGLVVGTGETGSLNTDTGEIFVGVVQVRPPFVDSVSAGMGFFIVDDTLAILAVDFLTVEPTATLKATGSRALVILSRGDVDISGLIDISAGCPDGSLQCGGPGGGAGSTQTQSAGGCGPGADGYGELGAPDETGGGGGALGQAGASAGNGRAGEPGGAGGQIDGCPDLSLVPLRGGSGGGEGAMPGTGGDGGGGGGGLQISSYTLISFGTDGEIYAGGGGGGGGAGGFGEGGGGGGSGGAILLEAPIIAAETGTLTANGGGGGGGGIGGATAGQSGSRDVTQADGGLATASSTPGGPGGSLSGDAQPSPGGADGTGGAGGGYGIIRLNTPAANLNAADALISPAHSRGDPTVQ